jgi:flagellar motility protein MotE (MotC chaperone)
MGLQSMEEVEDELGLEILWSMSQRKSARVLTFLQ